jgi:phenylalanine-4-hydroxylase
MYAQDLLPTNHAGGPAALVDLDPDHPGFRDEVYRQRRLQIAEIALQHQTGRPVPHAPYVDAEHAVWSHVTGLLAELHPELICRELIELRALIGLPEAHIPQLEDVNKVLQDVAGFRMEPVAGLVSTRTFLRYLGKRVFLSTQYIRHHSRPLYTPEPDVLHELIGHASTLVHPGISELNRLLGVAAVEANDAEMDRIANVYWYTMEFGLVREGDQIKAFGAGLLSSVGELQNFAERSELLPWDLAQIARTPYDPTTFQPQLFVAPSFTRLLVDVARWVRTGGWRQP